VNRPDQLRRRIKSLTWLFIIGLILSGATAIPLDVELEWLVDFTGARPLVKAPASTVAPAWAVWLVKVQSALHDTTAKYPFMAYGTDWLAFGHFVIALAFVGALRDPVRNVWLHVRNDRVRAGDSLCTRLRRRARDSNLVAVD